MFCFKHLPTRIRSLAHSCHPSDTIGIGHMTISERLNHICETEDVALAQLDARPALRPGASWRNFDDVHINRQIVRIFILRRYQLWPTQVPGELRRGGCALAFEKIFQHLKDPSYRLIPIGDDLDSGWGFPKTRKSESMTPWLGGGCHGYSDWFAGGL